MKIKRRGKEIELGDVKKVGELGKIIGLMFSRQEKAENLLFEFKKPVKMKIHSWFVFFPFLAIWLDKNNNILDLKKVKSFKFNIGIKEKYSKLIEIPFNKKNKELLILLCS